MVKLPAWKYVYYVIAMVIYYIIFCYLPMYGIIAAFQDCKPGMSFFRCEIRRAENFKEFYLNPMMAN
jgi:putative aldouronate transport system permease protein